jgi:hypothetical protein
VGERQVYRSQTASSLLPDSVQELRKGLGSRFTIEEKQQFEGHGGDWPFSRFNAPFRGMQRFCGVTRRRAGGWVRCIEVGRCVGKKREKTKWIQVDFRFKLE